MIGLHAAAHQCVEAHIGWFQAGALVLAIGGLIAGLAAHVANIRSERRFTACVETMMRVGTDAAGRA